jgi:gliding motility-associated-like protein
MANKFAGFILVVGAFVLPLLSFAQSKSDLSPITLTAESVGRPNVSEFGLKCPGSLTTCAAPISFPALTVGAQSCLNLQCNTGAAAGPDFPGNNCYDFTGPTAWFQFTAPAGTATMTVNITGASFANPYFMVFGTTDCSTYTLYNDGAECYQGAGGTATGNMAVPAGTTLLIAVSGQSGQSGNFNICLTPNADNSACNVDNELVVTATSFGSPLAGPYQPGEVVSFCYNINQYTQAGCNWLQGIVPTFGDCWAPSSFTATGQPVNITTPLAQAGDYCPGQWGWWPAGSVIYNSPAFNVGAGWFYTASSFTGGAIPTDPDNSWGDGNGMCGMVSSMGACDGATSGLTWSVCFNLTVRTDCENGTNCAVTMKTYSDGEIGNWTQLGCAADIPTVYNAASICCLMTVNAGTTQTICSTGAANLNGVVTNNEGPTTYSWTASPVSAQSGISNSTILNPTFTPPPGVTGPVVLTLTVTDDNCTLSSQVTVNVTPLPTAAINYAGTPFCTSVLSAQPVSLSGTGAFTGGTYSATPGGLTMNASTGAITPSTSTPGTYTVTYTTPASGGCPAVIATTSVTITAAPTAVIDYADPFCTNLGPQTVSISGTGAFTGGGYSTVGPLTLNTSNGTVTPSTSTPGSYTVTYTIPATGGCAAVPVTTPVVITALPTTTISYAGSPFCTTVGTAQPVTLNGTGAYTGGSYAAVPAGLTINTSTGAVTPSTSIPGTFTVTYTTLASGGCPAVQAIASVTITAAPTATIDYADPFCTSSGLQSVSISGTGAFTGGGYSTVGPLTLNTSNGTITPSTSTPGSYTVTYTIPASGGCVAVPVTTTVAITLQPTATIDYADPFCTSVATAQGVTLNGTGAFSGGSYASIPGGLTLNTANGSITPSSSTPGSYTVTYTIPAVSGCPSTDVNTTVVINPVPVFTLSGTSPTTCNGTDGFIVISGLTAGTSYNVSYNDDGVPQGPFNLVSNGSGEITILGLNAGSYDNFLITLMSTGCAGTSATTVSLLNPGAPDVFDIVDVVICDATYTLPVITGSALNSPSYWSGPNGTGTQFFANDVISSTMLMYIYDANGPCTDQENFQITINTSPTATIAYATSPWCVDNSTSQVVALSGTNAFSGGSYAGPVGLSINTFNGSITPSLSTPGTYTVTYSTVAAGGCPSVDATTSVTITPLPTASIDYADPFCVSETNLQAVDLSGTNAYTGGTFSADPGLDLDPVSGEINPNGSNPNTYLVTYTTPISGGCSSVIATTSVVVNPGPTSTIDYSDPFCTNFAGSAAVTQTGTGSYLGGDFSVIPAGLALNTVSGAITPSSSTAGSYTVTYTIPASGGCPESDVTTTVLITELPTASIDYADPFCTSDATAQVVTSSGSANWTTGAYSADPGLSIDPSTGAVDASLSSGGTYTVTYTIPLADGCPAVSTTTSVTITQAPTAAISYNDPYCESVLGIEVVNLSGTGAYLGGDFSSTPAGLTLNTASGGVEPSTSLPNVYTVTYTIPASSGCPESDVTTSLTIFEVPVFTLNGTSPSVCNGSDGFVVISGLNPNTTYDLVYTDDLVSSGTISITTDGSGNYTLSGLDAGDYAGFVVTGNGCSGSNSSLIELLNPDAPNIAPLSSATACDQFTLQPITGINLTGNEAYYTGPNGTGTQYNSGSVITATTTLYLYDIDGTCFDEEIFQITINNTPLIDNPGPQVACNSYELPMITGTFLTGNEAYYSQTFAGGTTWDAGDELTSNQTVYIYDFVGNCDNEVSFTVTITPLPTVTGVTGGTTYCAGETVAPIEVAVTGTADWTIEYTLNGVAQTATGSASPINLGNAAGAYTVTGVTDAGCSNTASGTQTITVNAIPDAPTAGNDSTYCSAWTLVPMTATGTGGTMTWYSSTGSVLGTGDSFTPLSGEGTTLYYVTETLLGCEGASSEVMITINVCDITTPTAFTPDGDGVNETWQIVDLDIVYPDNVVRIYNRWGNLIFEHDSSKDGAYSTKEWDGTYKGEALPVGSYYFAIEFNNEEKESSTGTVSILKK